MIDTSKTPARALRVATLATAVLVVAVTVAVYHLDGAKPSIAAAANTPHVIVAGPEGVQIFSATDKRLVRTLLDASFADGLSGVDVAPDGSVYASRVSSDRSCAHEAVPELVRVNGSTGKTVGFLHGASSPLVSPDGRWIAYSLHDSCAPKRLGVTDLTTGEHYHLGTDGLVRTPVAWSRDSDALLFRLGDPAQPGSYIRWVGVPDPEALEPLEPLVGLLPERTTAAAFMPDGRLVAAVALDAVNRRVSGYRLVIVDEAGTLVEHLFDELRVMPGMIALRVSVDGKGRVYVLDNEGRVLTWQHGDSAARPIVQPVKDGTWLPARQSVPEAPR